MRSDPIAPRRANALRCCRKSSSRRWRRCPPQEQERLDPDAAGNSKYRPWWLGLIGGESTTGVDRATASGATQKTNLNEVRYAKKKRRLAKQTVASLSHSKL